MSTSDEMRDKSGRVIYRLQGNKVYHGSEFILEVTESTPYLTHVRDSERRALFDLIDKDVLKNRKGGCAFSHNSNSFNIETFGRKVRIKGSKYGNFLELDGRIRTWKIAVLIYNKLQREEEAAAEQKALKEDAQARGIYTGELHEALCDLGTTVDEIEEMVKSHPDWMIKMDENKCLPIHLGVRRQNVEILQVLLDNGGEKCIDIPDSFGKTPLMLAIYYGDSKSVRLLLERGADVNPSYKTKDQSPLLCALYWKQKKASKIVPGVDYTKSELIKELISRGAKIDKDGEEGAKLLASAASVADLESVTLFVDAGIDVNVVVDGSTPLYMALFKTLDKDYEDEAYKVADFLISRGADVKCLSQKGGKGDNIFCLAVISHNDRLVDYLLSKNVDVNCTNKQGETPLDLAVKLLRINMVKKLRAAGAHGTKSALKKAFIHS